MTAQVNSFSNIQFASSKGCHTFSTLKGFPLVLLFSLKILRHQGNSFLRGGVTTPILSSTWIMAKLWDLDEMILSNMQMWYLVELESQWWYDY